MSLIQLGQHARPVHRDCMSPEDTELFQGMFIYAKLEGNPNRR